MRPVSKYMNMIIDFNQIEETVFPNFKGGEKEFSANMFFDGTNRMFKGCLVPGATIGMHTHEDSCEVIFILKGRGVILEKNQEGEDTASAVSEGDCLYCPKGGSHSLQNNSDENLIFYAVVPKQ